MWTGSDEDLQQFMDKINAIHPTIKFTHECDKELTFLDMTVHKGHNFHETGILDIKARIMKTTICLQKFSEYCKKAIATDETRRYLRTTSRKETFTTMTTQLKEKLIQRGYKAKEIKGLINPIQFESKEALLSLTTTYKETQPLVVPIKFNDNNQLIRQTILSDWHLISSNPARSLSFATKPMIANEKNPSLANKLIRAKVKTTLEIADPSLQPKSHRQDPTPAIQTYIPNLFPKAFTMNKCKRTRCTVCPKLKAKQFSINYATQIL